jgi:hypothetical protein
MHAQALLKSTPEGACAHTRADLRGQAETARFFDGLSVVDPGVVAAGKWRPGSELDEARPSGAWCGVGRKR